MDLLWPKAAEYPHVFHIFFATECPAEQPEFGSTCSLPEAAQCPYGEECCCGQCHPRRRSTFKAYIIYYMHNVDDGRSYAQHHELS